MITVSKIVRNTIANIYLLRCLIYIWDKIFAPQIYLAWGLYTTGRVKNIGLNSRFLGKSEVLNPENLTIGDNVRIGRGCFLFCMGGLNIGSGTVLSRNITIYTANHKTESEYIPYDNTYEMRPVNIGKGVWIGMNAAIVPGVNIGDGAIIGMNTVVTKDVPAGHTVVGSQSRTVKQRDMVKFNSKMVKNYIFAQKWPES